MNKMQIINNVKEKAGNKTFWNGVSNYVNQHGSTLACLGSAVGMAFAIFAAFKASRDIIAIKDTYTSENEKIDYSEENGVISEDEAKQQRKEAKTMRNLRYILAYKWVLVSGCSALALMGLSQYVSGARIAELTAIAAFNQEKVKSLIENGKELIGEEKFKEIEDKAFEDVLINNFFGEDGPTARRISIRNGHLFVDTNTAIIFQIDEQDLKDVLEHAKEYCERNHGLETAKFYEMLGFVDIPKRAAGKFWGPKCPFEAWIGSGTYGGAIFPTLEFKNMPTDGYRAGVPGFTKN